jgi:putative peptidoglycan lipid II flippase
MLKSTGAMGVATFLSRLLGMARETVYASFMGAGPVAGAFKMALMIPNLFRRLLGEGALTAAFIPIFKEKEKRQGEAEMWRSANSVLSGLIVAAGIISILVMIGITIVLHGKYLWLKDDTRLMLQLSRIMFPYMLLACAAAVLMGMLNARGHFFVPAMGSAILNIVLIATVVCVAPFFGANLEKQIVILAFGVLVAGVAQAAYQTPTLFKEGFRFQWINPFHNEVVHTVVLKMIPGMMGVAAFQLNVLITQSIAWHTSPEVVASFDYAVRLMEFPQGIFGISLATYLLPTLSGLAAEKKYPEFRQTYRDALGYLIFINLLASILLLVLAKPMIRLLFEHGKFGALATENASFALTCLAPGLVLFSINNITARAFYALGDTSTPMKISSVCLGLNVIFGAFLIPAYKEGGMGVANTMSAAFNSYFLIYGLRRKLKSLQIGELPSLVGRMLAVGFTAGVAAWITSHYWENSVGHARFAARLGGVFVPIGAATLVYFALLAWLRVPQVHDVIGLFTQRLRIASKRPEDISK